MLLAEYEKSFVPELLHEPSTLFLDFSEAILDDWVVAAQARLRAVDARSSGPEVVEVRIAGSHVNLRRERDFRSIGWWARRLSCGKELVRSVNAGARIGQQSEVAVWEPRARCASLPYIACMTHGFAKNKNTLLGNSQGYDLLVLLRLCHGYEHARV